MNEHLQRIVDQGLVVSRTGALDFVLEVLEHSIVESNGDLGLPGIDLDDRTPCRARNIDVAIRLSDDLFYTVSFVACSRQLASALNGSQLIFDNVIVWTNVFGINQWIEDSIDSCGRWSDPLWERDQARPGQRNLRGRCG